MIHARKSREQLEQELEKANRNIAKLKTRNRQQQHFLERLGFPMCLCAPDGKILLMNKQFAAFHEREPQTLIGEHISRLCPGQEQQVVDHISHTHETGEEGEYETDYIMADGTKRWFRGHYFPVMDESGQRAAVQIISRDITEEKIARSEKERISERFRLAMEACKDGVWDWDVQSGEVYYSPGYKSMLGYTDEDFPNLVNSWSEKVHPEDWDKVRQVNLDSMMNRCSRFDIEFRMRSKSGKWQWVLGRGEVVDRDETGRATRIVGTHTDITDLKESTERLHTLIETASSAIVTLDLEGNYTSWNSSWCEMLGYSREEIDGMNAFTVTHPDDQEKGSRRIASLLNGEITSYRDEKRFIRKDGSILWADISASVLKNSDGEFVEIIAVIIDTSKRKQTEEALKTSEERYRSMADHMSSGMAVYEPIDSGRDFLFRGLNPAAEKIAMVNRKDDLGKSFLSLFPRMADSELLKALQRVWRTGEPEILPPFYYKDHLREGWRENRIYKLPSGEVVALFDDVTERIETTRALEISEERMKLAFEAVNDGVWDWQIESGETYFSSRWFTMLGYEPRELPSTYETWKLLLHPEDQDVIIEKVESHLESGESFQVEFRLRSKCGNWQWILGRGMVVDVDERGRAARMIGTHMDITERVEALEALQASEERFRNLLEDVERVAVRGYDESRRIIFWNGASEELYGYKRAEVMGKNCLILPREQEAELTDMLDSWITDGVPFPAGELSVLHKDGSLRSVYSSHVMQVNSQESREFYFIDVDLTEIKMAYSKLVKAKEQAEAASKAKSMFLANMSHELRTPLNGIMGMHHVLKMTELDEEQEEYLSLAQASARRLTNLLNDILDLAKVEAGRMQLTDNSFNLTELLQDIEQLFRASSKKEKAECRCATDPLIPEILVGDSARLRQIISNLIGNGIKFAETGKIIIEAHLVSSPSNTEDFRVLFSVSDTGTGIPEEKIVSIFESFTQADESATRAHQGAGLGLAIVRQLVSLMGGNMSVESEVGIGTTFHFCLPFKAGSKGGPEQVEPAETEGGSPASLDVLLAEDDLISRLVFQKVLEKNDCFVTSVENGRAVIDAVGDKRFDVVFMDVQMPEMDGTEATRIIRSGKAGKSIADIPIIALTAHAMAGDKEKLLETGMDDYISKPVDIDLLNRILQRIRNGVYAS